MNLSNFRLLAAGVALLAALKGHAQSPKLIPLHPSGIYLVGEKAGWNVELPSGSTLPAGGYTYTLKKNNSELIQSGEIDSANPSAIQVTLDEPAMLYLEIISTADKAKVVAGAAVAPTQLQPTAPRPTDFDAFWSSKIELLHAIAPEPIVTPGDSGRQDVDYATVKLKSINGAHVHGQIAKPARSGKFPALLVLQYAGGPYPLQKGWVTDRAAEGWLALNIEPHDVPGNLPPEFYAALPALIKGYNAIYNDDRDRNYFLQMYLGAYRAADYLTGHPDWDGRTLVATGTSMGGQQSFAVAGLHPKITHMIVHVPAGADAHAALHGRIAGYPNWDLSRPGVPETSLYFDAVNFAPRITATCLLSMGFLDNVTPPAGIWTAFNQMRSPKEVVPLPEAAHNHQSTPGQQKAYLDRSAVWFKSLVTKGEAPPLQHLAVRR